MRIDATMTSDVIVVGGGPAGLAFARSLAGSGLRIVVIERQPMPALAMPAEDGREIALTRRSVATLRALGAWSHIDPADIAPLRRAAVLNGGSPFALTFGPDDDRTGADDEKGEEKDGDGTLGRLVGNHLIRRALFRAVAGQADLDIVAGIGVASVATGLDGVSVVLDDGRCITGRLLVAADSRFSATRHQLGIGAEVNRLGRSMLLCRVAHEDDHRGVATDWFDHHQTLAMLPLVGRMSSAVLTLPAGEIDRLAALDAASLGAAITRRYRSRLGAMRVVGGPHVYPLATTYARHFAATRAALIGDAAVGMHPVTAHGFNLGLRSQATLAALVIAAAARGRDIGEAMLLRRYEAVHRLATRPLYTATNMIVRLYTGEGTAARIARHAGLRLADRLPPVRDGVTALLMRH